MSSSLRNSIIGFLGIFAAFIVVGCGPDKEVLVSDVTPSAPGKNQTGIENPPSVPKSAGKKIGVIGGSQSGQIENSHMVLVLGGHIYKQNIFTLSSAAKNSLPTQFASYQMKYLEVAALPEKARAVAIAEGRWDSKQSLQLIHLGNARSATILVAKKGEAFHGLAVLGKTVLLVMDSGAGSTLLALNTTTLKLIEVDKIEKGKFTQPSFSENAGRIFYSHESGQKSGVFSKTFSLAEGDLTVGKKEKFIESELGEKILHFRYSPLGEKYLYLKQSGKLSQLVVAEHEVVGKTVGKVVSETGVSVFDPSWSFDGSMILYWSESVDAQAVRVFTLANGHHETLANILVSGSTRVCPAWSPNATSVYYTSSTGYWNHIFKVVVSNKERIQMTDPNMVESYSCPRVIGKYR